MKVTRKCHDCKEEFHKDEMIEYATLTGKTTYWYCRTCYEEKLAREKFQHKVCEIFGIKSPGPLIWTQRKHIRETYGYTDNTIIECLEYIYNVKRMNKLKESLGLINPRSVEEMRKWKKEREAIGSSLNAALTNTVINKQVVSVRENTRQRPKINLDDALLD